MIATRRGLAIVCGVAIVLAIALGLDVARQPAVTSRALLPGFDAGEVQALIWQRPGVADVVLWNKPSGWGLALAGEARPEAWILPDVGAVHDVLDTLRGARWHRDGRATPSHATLTVKTPRGDHVIGIGAPLAGTEQVWLTVDGTALPSGSAAGRGPAAPVDGRGVLVDRWVARALEDAPDQLRVRTPFDAPAAFASIELVGLGTGQSSGSAVHVGVAELTLVPHPWRLTRPAPMLVAPGPAAALERALAAITIVRFSDTPSQARDLTITARWDSQRFIRLVLGGACPGATALVAVSGTYGDGCIADTVAAAVERAARTLSAPDGDVIELRPAPIEPAQITLADGATLDVTRGRIADEPADPARVAELVAALAAPGISVARPARRPASAPPPSTVTVTARDGAKITLELLGGDLVARTGESLTLKLAPGAIRLLTRSSRALRDLTLWLEEPTTISALVVDDVRYQRGAVIGDWTRLPGGPVDRQAVEAVIAQLAAPRALTELAVPVAVVHRLSLTITPPTGASITRTLGVGAPRRDGCPVQRDRDALLLPSALCALVDRTALPSGSADGRGAPAVDRTALPSGSAAGRGSPAVDHIRPK